MTLKHNETHIYYSNDCAVEQQDKEIWIDQNLVYSCCKGDEVEYTEGNKSDSPFYGQEALQTMYYTDRGNVQYNNEDGSFYFLLDDGNMNTYIDGQLQIDDPNGDYVEFIEFANSVMSK